MASVNFINFTSADRRLTIFGIEPIGRRPTDIWQPSTGASGGLEPPHSQGSKPGRRSGRDRPEGCVGKEGRTGRSGVSVQAARRRPVQPSGRPPKGAGAFWRTAASLVGHDETSSLPPSLLAVRQNALRPGHCGDRVWTL